MSKIQKTCPSCNNGVMVRTIKEENGKKKEKVVCNNCNKEFDMIVDKMSDRESVRQSTILTEE